MKQTHSGSVTITSSRSLAQIIIAGKLCLLWQLSSWYLENFVFVCEYMASSSRKKCRHYNVEYLRYGFIENSKDPKLPYCLSCQISLSNEAKQPSRLSGYQARKHPENVGKPIAYFENLKLQFQQINTVGLFFKNRRRLSTAGSSFLTNC